MSRRILIAEDEPSILVSLQFLLRLPDYEVRVARDGDEALRLVRSFTPHLVLLDVMMPVLNGFQICERIRENPAWKEIKIVMLSARGRESEVDKGLALGANAYVTKPFSTKALLAQVRELLAPPR